jgi:hypothetical protein
VDRGQTVYGPSIAMCRVVAKGSFGSRKSLWGYKNLIARWSSRLNMANAQIEVIGSRTL